MSSSSDATPPRVVKGIINVQPMVRGELASLKKDDRPRNRDHLKKWFDVVSVTEFEERKFLLELVSLGEKETVKAQESAKHIKLNDERTMFVYECNFEVPGDFGEIGALLIQNEHKKETYIKNIVLDDGEVTFTCESWIHSKNDDPSCRIFFANKSYLPSKTPAGLKSLRKKDLESLRGNGEGQRKSFERIYDYDTYNDLGDARPVLGITVDGAQPVLSKTVDDAQPVLGTTVDDVRPVLGKYPYPRRCRTGRTKTSEDKEQRNTTCFYVPRDEEFSDTKAVAYGTSILYTMAQNLVPSLGKNKAPSDIESLFDKCVEIIGPEYGRLSVLRRLLKDFTTGMKTVQEMRTTREKDDKSFCWYRDEEFCRQTLAGLNPYSIQLVTDWPITKSKLAENVYGPAESAITEEIVNQIIGSFMTLDEALNHKKLFLLDYHDMLLPHVNNVRELEGTTLYGSRTLMFLTSIGTLRPIAIELTRPPNNMKKPPKERVYWKHVYTPYSDALLWKLAKAHVLAHDSCYHQLVSHWLRTHCVTEPYIIATHRCLSKMHPIHRLLSPHFRYTMQINALARLALINAGGIIESTFSLKKYSMQLSSDAYKQWRFDNEALPADLISRGMAVKDLSEPHGIKLTIEDYPFANDGLLLWDAIKHWATAYVNHYYPQPRNPQPRNVVESDEELQDWWEEIKTKGHEDKKDEPWWPQLKTQQDLIGIVTTIMWVTSGHHSAVNFGQYTAGYFPYRPTIARTNMPNEDLTDGEWEALQNNLNCENVLNDCLPMKDQSTIVMTLLDILSSHSPDEEYIGVNMEPAWEADPVIKAAFQDLSGRLKELEGIIDSRNCDPNLRNRRGRGLVPYEIFKPSSEPGVTGKGVPYSISI